MLWYQPIAARSYGYGDTTATYICRALVPSRMYSKNQYNTGVRVWNYVIIYIPTQKCKYSVITDCDIILHKHYITRKYKSRLYKVQKIRTYELKERISRARQDGMKLWLIRLLLEEGLVLSWWVYLSSSCKIWTCKCRVISGQPSECKSPNGKYN